MNESFNEHEFRQYLEYEEALSQEVEAAEQEERLHERNFTSEMLAEGLPVKGLLDSLQDDPKLSLIGLRIDLKNNIEQFVALHPEVNDERASYTRYDIILEGKLVEYDHCKILGQFASAYSLYELAPNHPDLLKDVQYAILQAEYLDDAAKVQWNSIATRYMSGDSINMDHPEQDEFVIAKRRDESSQALQIARDERQTIYDLLNENGDALGLRTHDDSQQFMSKLATAIIYEQTGFADFHLRVVYELGEKIGLSSSEIETIHTWTRSQLGRFQ